MHRSEGDLIPIPDRSCWKVARADRAAVIVDADDYFRYARAAMCEARRRIMLIGWDFDARIHLVRPEEGEEAPTAVGEFVLWLVDRNPDLEVYLLRWDFGAVKALFRGTSVFTLAKWMSHPRIHVRLDSMHPPGASHHQKIVVIDDCFAFCGGIDMTGDRWDTRAHRDADPGRKRPDGSPYKPWHDATTALQGEAAACLGEHGRMRWRNAGGDELAPVGAAGAIWPDALVPQFEDVAVAIARTAPEMSGRSAIREIEQLYLDEIASARRWIYAESQYFASRKIAIAMAKRLEESDGPEIMIVNPVSADGWLEQVAMDTARARLVQALRQRDRHGRLQIYHPFTSAGEPIYVHAKILIVDDRIVRVGSSNMNNRSMRLDTECDVAIDAALPGNGAIGDRIVSIRNSLIGEHLDIDPMVVAERLRETGSLIDTIETLRGSGKSLRPYIVPDRADVEKWLADNEVLDPEGPEEMFEPLTRRGLLRSLKRRR